MMISSLIAPPVGKQPRATRMADWDTSTGFGSCPTSRAGAENAFTLVELLMVIALTCILAAFVFAGASRAKDKADQSTCVANLRQMGVAINQYTADNNGKYPGPAWTSVTKNISERPPSLSSHPLTHFIYPYLGVTLVKGQSVTVKALVCPATERNNPQAAAHYQRIPSDQLSPFGSINNVPPMSVFTVEQRLRKPMSKIVAIYDTDSPGLGPIHSGGRNYLFLDGHVAWNKGTSLPQ